MSKATTLLLVLIAASSGAGATIIYDRIAVDQPAGKTMPETLESPSPDTSEVVCLLTPDELQKQRGELLPGLFKRAEKVTDLPDGLRLEFPHSPSLLKELTEIIAREQVCCSFLRFQLSVEPGAGPVTLEVTGPEGTREMLKGL